MDKYIIDFTGFDKLTDMQNAAEYFYEVIIRALNLPDWCGKNPDALWDMLTGYINLPALICIKGMNELPITLTTHVKTAKDVFSRACEFNMNFMTVEYID